MNSCQLLTLIVVIVLCMFTIVRELQKPYKVLLKTCGGTVIEYNYHNPPKNIKERLSK